jgi:hypothetical protein
MADTYEEDLLKWRAARDAGIRAENGWLALAGLTWLKPGANTIGSDAASDVLLPRRAPASLGRFLNEPGGVKFQPAPGSAARVNGEPVSDPLLMRTDVQADPSFVTLDGMRLAVIERPSGIGVRVWDNQRPERRLHPPREWFPPDRRFRVLARYLRYPAPKPVLLPDTFGETIEGTMDGQVSFGLDGRTFTLDVTELDDGRLDMQIRDRTSGKETYGSGRYYYTDEPVVDGQITLDFNYAYSPPCAFTEFATCVFAPQQNFIDARIEAGELYRAHLSDASP